MVVVVVLVPVDVEVGPVVSFGTLSDALVVSPPNPISAVAPGVVSIATETTEAVDVAVTVVPAIRLSASVVVSGSVVPASSVVDTPAVLAGGVPVVNRSSSGGVLVQRADSVVII